MRALVFWQNIPSMHQAPLIRAVAECSRARVVVVTEADLPSDRKQQGWRMPDFGKAELVIAPGRPERLRLLCDAGAESAHIFSGFSAYPETAWTLQRAITRDLQVGVYAEAPRTNEGLGRTMARKFRSRLHALRYDRRIDFLLAPGTFAVNWYRSSGFSHHKVIPFAYFVDDPPQDRIADDTHNETLQFLFVGQLIHRKGMDLLFQALTHIRATKWRLTILGSGDLELRLRRQAEAAQIADRLTWTGNLDNTTVRHHMLRADCLILPSRFDGWGAVVNEALLCGTPVIVSDRCGASSVITAALAGQTFPAGNIGALRAALGTQASYGPVLAARRASLRDWAHRAISAEAGANYLLDVISGKQPPPAAPWCRTSEFPYQHDTGEVASAKLENLGGQTAC